MVVFEVLFLLVAEARWVQRLLVRAVFTVVILLQIAWLEVLIASEYALKVVGERIKEGLIRLLKLLLK